MMNSTIMWTAVGISIGAIIWKFSPISVWDLARPFLGDEGAEVDEREDEEVKENNGGIIDFALDILAPALDPDYQQNNENVPELIGFALGFGAAAIEDYIQNYENIPENERREPNPIRNRTSDNQQNRYYNHQYYNNEPERFRNKRGNIGTYGETNRGTKYTMYNNKDGSTVKHYPKTGKNYVVRSATRNRRNNYY